MLPRFKLTLLFSFFLFLGNSSVAQWNQIDYNGGSTFQIIKINQTAFVQTSSGIYKSLDSGNTWVNTNNDTILKLLLIPNFTAMGSHPKMFTYGGVLYFKYQNYLLKSYDDGSNWIKCTLPISLKFIDYYFLKDTLFAFTGTVDQKFYKLVLDSFIYQAYSTNFWIIFQTEDGSIYNFNPFGPQQGLYKSLNGIDFVEISMSGLPKNDSLWIDNYYYYKYHISEFCGIGNYSFAVANDSTVYVSKNNNTWERTKNGLPNGIININYITINENSVFIRLRSTRSDDEIYRSDDNGKNWYKSDLISFVSKVKFGNRIIRPSNSGVYISDDNGVSWKNTSLGIKTTYIDFMKSFGNKLFAFNNNKNTLILSNDHGKTWIEPTGLTNHGGFVRDQFVLSKNRAFILSTNGVYYSIDSGESWNRFYYPTDINYINWMNLNEDGSAFIQSFDSANNRHFYKTTNYINFEKIDSLLPLDANLISDFIIFKGVWYAWSYVNSKIYKTLDSGITWTLDMIDLPTSVRFKFSSLNEFDGNLVLCVFDINNQLPPRMYVHDGLKWVRKACNGIDSKMYSFDLINRFNVFYTADFFSKKVYYSKDFGENWYMIDTLGLINSVTITVDALTATDEGLFFGTHNVGMWKHPLMKVKTGIDFSDKKSELVVYPNPANTFITIQGDFNTNTQYEIANLQGQLVQEGILGTIINIENLPSGLYYLQLKNKDSFSYTKFLKF